MSQKQVTDIPSLIPKTGMDSSVVAKFNRAKRVKVEPDQVIQTPITKTVKLKVRCPSCGNECHHIEERNVPLDSPLKDGDYLRIDHDPGTPWYAG